MGDDGDCNEGSYDGHSACIEEPGVGDAPEQHVTQHAEGNGEGQRKGRQQGGRQKTAPKKKWVVREAIFEHVKEFRYYVNFCAFTKLYEQWSYMPTAKWSTK